MLIELSIGDEYETAPDGTAWYYVTAYTMADYARDDQTILGATWENADDIQAYATVGPIWSEERSEDENLAQFREEGYEVEVLI